MGSVIIPPSPFGSKTPPKTQYGNEGAYNAALATSSEAYDDIMKGYKDIINQPKNVTQLKYNSLSPTQAFYQQSPELSNALSYFGNLAKSGGYEDSELSSLRARATAPITSIYDSAKRNLDRQKRLSGGYSPSYNASIGRMARESSQQVAAASTDIEGRIAETLANNRLSASNSYNNALAQREAEINRINQMNAAEYSRINQLNADNELRYADYNRSAMEAAQNERVRALEGMRGLYGTTPALVNEFGQQVAQSRNQRSQEEELALRRDMGYINAGVGAIRGIYG